MPLVTVTKTGRRVVHIALLLGRLQAQLLAEPGWQDLSLSSRKRFPEDAGALQNQDKERGGSKLGHPCFCRFLLSDFRMLQVIDVEDSPEVKRARCMEKLDMAHAIAGTFKHEEGKEAKDPRYLKFARCPDYAVAFFVPWIV